MTADNQNTNTLAIALQAVRLYAEMHPRPSHVTQHQACEIMGRSHPTIRKMIRSGELRLNAAGLIPMSEIDRAMAPKMPHAQTETA